MLIVRPSTCARPRMRRWFRTAPAILGLAITSALSYGQSTFGTVLGTVKDASGSVIAKATVELVNQGTNAVRTAMTGETGSYQFVDVEIGKYELKDRKSVV